MVSLPAVPAVNVVEQLPPSSVQTVGSNDPPLLAENATVPVGVDEAPLAVSCTDTTQFDGAPAVAAAQEKASVVDVERPPPPVVVVLAL